MLAYNPQTPILLLVFNRPKLTQILFEAVKNVKPKKLYVVADGPRNSAEAIKCNEVRNVFKFVDWDCELITNFRDVNLGCGKGVSDGIKWFFEQEECGIVLEDDCIPSLSFFGYCSYLLDYYKNDTRIGHIAGSNFQDGTIRENGSYYFSGLTHVWGWAGWRRVWKDYDFDISTFPEFDKSFEGLPSHKPFSGYWANVLDKMYKKEIDTWDYQYAYLNLIKGYKSIMPNINMICNIGIGADATHTLTAHPFANMKALEMHEITHPTFFIQNVEADLYTQTKEYYVEVVKKGFFSRLWKKIKNRIKN